jgi:hypothetical protein
MMLLGLFGFAVEVHAEDPVPSVTLTCETCSSLSQLATVAQNYFQTHRMVIPPGYNTAQRLLPCYWSRWNPGTGEPVEAFFDNCTVAAVTSKQHPITGYFEFASLIDNVASVNALTPSDLMARDLDNRIVARASAMPPVTLPPGITPSDEYEAVILPAIINQVQILTPNGQVEFWHGLVNFGQFVSVNVAMGGKTYKVYVNDTITVQFANGQTVKVQLLNPLSSIPWILVDGSLRNADGTDPNRPRPTTSTAPYGAQSFTYTYSGNSFNISYIPVVYGVSASRIQRQGVITIITLTTVGGQLKETNLQD